MSVSNYTALFIIPLRFFLPVYNTTNTPIEYRATTRFKVSDGFRPPPACTYVPPIRNIRVSLSRKMSDIDPIP